MRYEMIGNPEARVWLLVFNAGDPVVEGILSFAMDADVRASRVSGIGAFSECGIAFFDRDSRAYEEIPVTEQVEVLSLLGNITLGPEGRHRLHAHVTLGRRDGSTLGGHFLDGRNRPNSEKRAEM